MAKQEYLPLSNDQESQESELSSRPFASEIRSKRSCLLNWILLPTVILFALTLLITPSSFSLPSCHHLKKAAPIPTCFSNLSPLPLSSYLSRQHLLAATLIEQNISAYISEPSPTSLYFFNVSSSQWHLSERPFLFVVVPFTHPDGAIAAQLSVIVPSFEETRAKEQLSIAGKDIKWLPWEESEDAYAKVGDVSGRIVVDEAMRVGVMDQLKRVIGNGEIGVATKEVRSLRERKSKEELALLKCANELTLHAIRATRDQVRIGQTELEVNDLLEKNFEVVGMPGTDGLVLFGANAALPHGASSSYKLKKEDFVLIDAGGKFHGYVADITRTFALPESKISKEHLAIWDLVHEAQAAAYAVVKPGVRASEVDDAARQVIAREGLEKKFTHRLGHGIGLEVHEEPYLNAGNKEFEILTGTSFSNEPGVYIEGEIGVRLEDCWHMEDRGAVSFTAQAVSPWNI
ncbi:peptidase M24, structural domain-containing protein [Mrakia frigida]|uniref:peptidase M24, structural domain-containing protein n=1 Tax=Mrakia frigida TaxID=29902 RepID=UPI003FCC1ACC